MITLDVICLASDTTKMAMMTTMMTLHAHMQDVDANAA